MHQVGDALVHRHQVQDPHVTWQVASNSRFSVAPCGHRGFREIDATAQQTALGPRCLEAVVNDRLGRDLCVAVVQGGSGWHLAVCRVKVVPDLHHAQPLAVLAGGCHQRRVQLVLALKASP